MERKKSAGITALGNFGIDTRNYRRDMLVGFAERNHSEMIDTFLDRKASSEVDMDNPKR